MEAALEGESWARVSSLVDLGAEAPEADTTRMKHVLIQLKTNPLPPVPGM